MSTPTTNPFAQNSDKPATMSTSVTADDRPANSDGKTSNQDSVPERENPFLKIMTSSMNFTVKPGEKLATADAEHGTPSASQNAARLSNPFSGARPPVNPFLPRAAPVQSSNYASSSGVQTRSATRASAACPESPSFRQNRWDAALDEIIMSHRGQVS